MSVLIVVRICALIYRASLPLYPAELRIEHGPEILGAALLETVGYE